MADAFKRYESGHHAAPVVSSIRIAVTGPALPEPEGSKEHAGTVCKFCRRFGG